MRTEFQDLQIHDDAELESLIGARILSREKLHHWPLSYVEKVTLADSRTLIYKSQFAAASVERAFYAQIRAPFLLSPIWSGTHDNCDIMLLPYSDCKPLATLNLNESDLDALITKLSADIQILRGAPIYLDISTIEKYRAIAERTCEILERNTGDMSLIAKLRDWIEGGAIACYRDTPVGYVHGDLFGGNVLIDDGEPRFIIDWQRPMLAPLPLENAIALRGESHLPHTPFDLLAIVNEVIWYATAGESWLPFVIPQAFAALSRFAKYFPEGT